MRHSAGRSSCSTAERTDDSGTHHLDWCIDTGEEALERGGALLYEHLATVHRFDPALAQGVHPPRLAWRIDQVECALRPGDVVDVHRERIVSREAERRRIDRDVNLDRSLGHTRCDPHPGAARPRG